MNTLIIINFETGDASCRYWDVPVIVCKDISTEDINTLEDSFMSYFDSDYDEDEDYEDSVEHVMDHSNLPWKPFKCNEATSINDYYQMYI